MTEATKPQIVKLGPPPETAQLISAMEKLLERVRAGEFETVFIIGICPNGQWATVARGKKLDPLRAVGIMESIKTDILQATETNEPTGF